LLWESGATTKAKICAEYTNVQMPGNDFDFDDIVFSAVCTYENIVIILSMSHLSQTSVI